MKGLLALSLVTLLFLPFTTGVSEAADFPRNVTVWVEPTLHINMTVDCDGQGNNQIKVDAGTEEDCLITLENYGNKKYDLEVRGPIGEESGWISWRFECPNLGDCSEEHADSGYQKPPRIKDINLEDGQTATFNLFVKPILVDESATISLQAQDFDEEQENEVWQNLETVTIDTTGERSDDYGPFIAPGFNNISVVVAFILSILSALIAKIR